MNVEKLLERKKKLEENLREQSKKIKQASAAMQRKKADDLLQLVTDCGLADMPLEKLRGILEAMKQEDKGERGEGR